MMHEVTKYWNVNINIHKVNGSVSAPHRDIINLIQNGQADIGLCSLWLIERHYNSVDLSIPYEEIFVNFLVPMPTLINDAAAIYNSLSMGVWFTLIFCLLLLGVLLTIITKYMLKKAEKRNSLTEYIFYLVGIVTGHVVHYSPQNASMRYLFMRCVSLYL